jgi:hypothetical protein
MLLLLLQRRDACRQFVDHSLQPVPVLHVEVTLLPLPLLPVDATLNHGEFVLTD